MSSPRNEFQESIYRQLRQLSPSLADLYEGARQMLASDEPLPGWSQFVPHAVREISARVPDLIRGTGTNRLDYAARLDGLTRLWQRSGLGTESVEVPLTGPTSQPRHDAALPVDVVGAVTQLVRDHIKSRAETFISKLEEAARLRARAADQSWLARWAREWHRSHTWAQAHAHVGERSAEPLFDDYRSEFARFERTLAGILGEYVTNKGGLDDLLANANGEPWALPPDVEVSEALRLAARPEEQRYFFERLRNPYWLDALAAAGALIPPDPIPTDDGVRYPWWPISAYVGRVAASHPDQFAAAKLIQPLLATKNVSIQRDLLQAMATLAPSALTELLQPVSEWITDTWRLTWIGDRLNDVIVNAARDEANIVGVRRILDALFEPHWHEPDAILGERASSRLSEWDAQQFAAQVIPRLREVSPLLLLSPLVLKLRSVLNRARPEPTAVLGYKDDHSVIWFSNLGGSELPHDAEDVLTYLLVSLLDELARLPALYDDVLLSLAEGGWIIHERLTQRFLARTVEARGASEDVLRRLSDVELAATYQTRREHDDLLAQAFPHLGQQERVDVLNTLRAAAARKGDDADQWLYQRLSHVSDHLPEATRAEFEEWREHFGEVVATDLVTVADWTGPRSPLDRGAAAAMSAQELAGCARGWSPSDSGMLFERPSWAGLSADTSGEAARRPAEFSALAGEFADCDPTIVNGLLKGLTTAIQGDLPLEWGPVLALIRDIAGRSEDSIPDRVARLEGDPSWAWSKMQGVELLEAALSKTPGPAIENRDAIWETLQALAEGCEAPVDPADRDPTTVSVNTARSRVVYATVSFVFWLQRHGVEGMPDEVGAFLSQILDHEHEPFVGMRVAVGHQLPQLAFIDSKWVIDALPELFPDTDEASSHWKGAWHSFLLYATPLPSAPVLESLEPYYRRAVEEIEPDHQVGDTHSDPVVRLGEHIVFMVLNGFWPIEHDVVGAYFEKAPLAARRRVLDWVGRGAKQEEPTAEWCERVRMLFEWRERALAEPQTDTSELRSIGWLVATELFPVEWWIERLPTILRSTAGGRRHYLPLVEMMGRVAACAGDHTEAALEVLELIVEQSEWERHEPYLGAAERILDLAMRRPALEHRARQVADRLTRAGHDEFGRYSE